MSSSITHERLAELVSGELVQGDPAGVVTGLNSITEAGPGEVTFLGNPRYLPALKTTRATAVLVGRDFAEPVEGVALIKVDNPTFAFSSVIRHFGPPQRSFVGGVHPTAVVAASVVFDPAKVSIGPHVVVEDDVVIGAGTVIHAGAFVGQGTKMGMDCVLHAHSIIKERCVLGNRVIVHSGAVLGSDGFGYEFTKGRHQKVEQVGIVQLDDDVEIGSCTTIDRARFGRTWIGEGSKIDNLVQIAHNVVIGKHTIIVSQVGISGSTRIGNYVTMAGQVGVAGHLEIGDQITILAKSGVAKSLLEPGPYTGYPARPLMEGRRMISAPARIPEMLDRIRALEKKLAALEKAGS